MIHTITKTELIQYYYKECSQSVKQLIESELDSNPEWKNYLNHLETVQNSTKIDLSPNSTLISIIMEESVATEHHSL